MHPKSYFLDRIGEKTFFLILFLYQFLFIFQGIDFTDEGFYGTFYQQIFRNPASVQYNFMYWLSGIIGGAYMYLFPSFGLLGIRLGGIFATTLTIIISYNLLKKYLDIRNLKIGLFTATVIISNDPKSLFYDNLSALFFVIMAYFLFNGLQRNKLLNFFYCGIFLSLNTFTKLSNIADASLGATILYAGYLNKTSIKYLLKQIGSSIAGFSISTVILIIVMKLIGHLGIFLNCIALVREMGKSHENTHGLLKLIRLFRYEYSHAIIYAIIILTTAIIAAFIVKKFKGKHNAPQITYISGFSILAISLFLTSKGTYVHAYLLLNIVTGLALIAALFIIINKNNPNKNIKILAFAGATMVIILPLGSDFGMYAAGRYALWILLPIAIDHYLTLNSFPINIRLGTVSVKTDKFFSPSSPVFLPKKQILVICKWGIGILIILFIFIALNNTWQDSSDRTKMVYLVNNKYLKGVFTTKEKSELINDLLVNSTKYIKKNDYVLAYDEIPLFYALTETRPFMHNSWTKLYDRNVFRSELQKEIDEKKLLPVVVYQKIMTLSNKWPDVTGDNKDWDLNQPRNFYIKQFLDKYHYKIAWESIAFRIYVAN
jgi:hypothetical protein